MADVMAEWPGWCGGPVGVSGSRQLVGDLEMRP